MTIRFGNASGYQTKTDYKITDGELDCGSVIHMYIKTIDKTVTTTNTTSICNIGIMGEPDACYESASIKYSEEAVPKYLPTNPGATIQDVVADSEAGKAATKLGCTPLKIKSASLEVSVTYKDTDALPTAEQIMNLTTADGLQTLGDMFSSLDLGNFVRISDSLDQPADNFGSRTVTYRAKKGYPTSRLAPTFGDAGSAEDCTYQAEAQMKQGDTPSITMGYTQYGIEMIPSA